MSLQKSVALLAAVKNELLESSSVLNEGVIQGGIRVATGETYIRVTDLINAGKRGKTVEEFVIYGLDFISGSRNAASDLLVGFKKDLGQTKDFYHAKSLAEKFMAAIKDSGAKDSHFEIEHNKLRGVDVAPAFFQKIVIDTKEFRLEADHNSFSVDDKSDTNNEPCLISPIQGSKAKSAAQFYKWVQGNEAKLKRMTFNEVHNEMMKDGIHAHYYCRMD